MATEQCFGAVATTTAHRFEVGDGSASPHDCEVLAAVFDRVEKVSEVAGRIGRAHVGHEIRLSELAPNC